jgi:hypothetical protein
MDHSEPLDPETARRVEGERRDALSAELQPGTPPPPPDPILLLAWKLRYSRPHKDTIAACDREFVMDLVAKELEELHKLADELYTCLGYPEGDNMARMQEILRGLVITGTEPEDPA